MQLSARNQLAGTVKSITVGVITAEVVVDVNGAEIVSVITKSAVESLGIKTGDAVTVVIKATEVMLATE